MTAGQPTSDCPCLAIIVGVRGDYLTFVAFPFPVGSQGWPSTDRSQVISQDSGDNSVHVVRHLINFTA